MDFQGHVWWHPRPFVSDIAILVLKGDVKLQLTGGSKVSDYWTENSKSSLVLKNRHSISAFRDSVTLYWCTGESEMEELVPE